MNKAKKKDIQSAIVIIVFAVLFYAFSYRIQPTTSDVLGSRFFPQAISIILVILGLILIVTSIISGKDPLSEEEETKLAKNDRINQPLILTTVFLFAYYFLCMGIGFLLTSILYLFGASRVLMSEEDKKDKKTQIIVAIVSIAVPIFLNTVFYQVFHIKLPTGSLF